MAKSKVDKYEGVDFPNDVVNKDAYVEWLESQKELENDARYVQTSDKDLTVDLCFIPTQLNKAIKHLPNDERDVLLEGASHWRGLITKSMHIKKKAFGPSLSGPNSWGQPLGPAHIKKAEIMDLFGRMYKPSEVHRIISMEWNYQVSLDQVSRFYKKNIDKITELQEEFKTKFSDIRLGHKRSRLDELSYMYDIRKGKYKDNGHSLSDEQQMMKVLEQIKKEVEGDLVINGKVKIDIEHSIKVTVHQQHMKELNITALIISRMAGRLNVDPNFIISRLAHSRYAQFAGFGGASMDEMQNEEIYYPTNIAYDMNSIEDNARMVQLEDERDSTLKPVAVSENLSLRDKLALKLKAKQDAVTNSKINVDISDKKSKE